MPKRQAAKLAAKLAKAISVLQEADITNQFKNGITELEPAEIH